MAEHEIKLSVVIPSYNEMKNIKRGVLDMVYSYLLQQSYKWEIVLTDDGSTDGTIQALRDFAEDKEEVRVIENHHSGKGPTVSSGMLAARGKYRLFTDFDQSTPIQEVNKALMLVNEGYDIVIGSREVSGARREEEPIHRHIMGRAFNILVQTLALRGIQDSQCGFKLFSQNATVVIFPSLVVYGGSDPRKDAFTGAFDVEALFLARKWGYKTKEMGVEWQHNETDRVDAIKDSFRMLRDIIRIRIAWLMGKYSLPHQE
jgi:dolichyl-phosphate beta-glucosyltransferase